MEKQPRRPLTVWLAGGVLAISSALFGTVLIRIFFVPDGATVQVQNILLLVALPLTGLVGLARRNFWGRDVTLLSIASLWAFILQGFWSIFGEKPIDVFRMPPLTLSVFVFLIILLILLPTLFARLRWGYASREFFGV